MPTEYWEAISLQLKINLGKQTNIRSCHSLVASQSETFSPSRPYVICPSFLLLHLHVHPPSCSLTISTHESPHCSQTCQDSSYPRPLGSLCPLPRRFSPDVCIYSSIHLFDQISAHMSPYPRAFLPGYRLPPLLCVFMVLIICRTYDYSIV